MKLAEKISCYLGGWGASRGKKQIWWFFVVVQLIHRLTQADISCTTMAHMFFFPLLADERELDNQRKTLSSIHLYLSLPSLADHSRSRHALWRRRPEWVVSSGRKVMNLLELKIRLVKDLSSKLTQQQTGVSKKGGRWWPATRRHGCWRTSWRTSCRWSRTRRSKARFAIDDKLTKGTKTLSKQSQSSEVVGPTH